MRKSFPEAIFEPRYMPAFDQRDPVWLGDLEGGSKQETPLLYDPVNRHKVGNALICHSDAWEEKWRFVPEGEVSDLERTYSPPFLTANFLVADLDKDGTKEILVTSHHTSGHPNQFVVLNGDKKLLGQY